MIDDRRSPRRARPLRRPSPPIAIGAVVAAAVVLAAPLAARAHVTATPDAAATAGGYGTLTFAFSHGCDGSPTSALVIEIPDGMGSVSPTIEPGWQIEVERDGEAGPVSQVTFTADRPVPDGLRAAVTLGVQYGADAGGRTLAFPVTQICEVGQTPWVEIAEDGEDAHDLESPAPTVAVGQPSAESEHRHAASGADAGASGVSALPIALGAGGLVLGAVALALSLVALRRPRR